MIPWRRGIGATLREARNRRKVELSEVEAATKIRARFLRAIENEEWEALPGGAYTARLHPHLRRLPRPRRRAAGGRATIPSADAAPPSGCPARRAGADSRRGRPRSALVVAAWSPLIVVVGALAGGGGGGARRRAGGAEAPAGRRRQRGSGGSGVASPRREARAVELSLATTAEVWVCLLDANGKALVDGAGPRRRGRRGPVPLR